MKFIGPGIIVSVAYMDPGNYSTAVAAGASFKYTLLFSVFVSNIFAVLLQCLCVKLGSVTGLDLAENCRQHLNPGVNMVLYILAEIAIVATDLAEVVGTAIAIEIVFGIPLTIGILLTVIDVMVVLIAYRPNSSMKQVRFFETFVSIFVALTCLCFVALLFRIDAPSKWELVKGYLPLSPRLLETQALYLSMAICGATVMPHSLYIGSASTQPRLRAFDAKIGNCSEVDTNESQDLEEKYKPSLAALRECLPYSYWELIISLFLVAMFVNSSILIVAGSTLFGKPDADDADLLSIYQMLCSYISPSAGFIFALAMLFSGQSAGIVCTMAGQIVSEGFIKWSFQPWIRRLVTRFIAICPCLLVVIFSGRQGIASVLNASQVVLSLILPFVSAPLLYFTSSSKFMTVNKQSSDETTSLVEGANQVNFKNSKLIIAFSILTWLAIASLNTFLVVQLARGEDVHF